MIDTVVWQGTFNGRFEDRQYAIRTFQEWNRRVGERIPADRLLVYEVTEGWAPLCRFLDKPIPATPFPHLNDGESFRRRVRRMQALSIAVPAFLTAVSVAAIAATAAKRSATPPRQHSTCDLQADLIAPTAGAPAGSSTGDHAATAEKAGCA